MLYIHVTENHEWSIVYRLDGVKATEVLVSDHAIALQEIDHKLRLMMGLAKGKTFLTQTGREL